MSSCPCRCDAEPLTKAHIAGMLGAERGIAAFGVARAEPVADDAVSRYETWIANGCHGSMDYLARYGDVRRDPRLLLEGARSLIVCAFPYYPHRDRPEDEPHIARYALGRDYHEVVRERLTEAAAEMRQRYGGDYRVCVDTAPLRERYWAERCGLGFVGRNCQLIVPGVGSYVFIGTLLTTLPILPTPPSEKGCGACGLCARACPGGALSSAGDFDARRCLSYLTIEHRGDFGPDVDLCGCLYGCDRCQEVCPHNRAPMPSLLPEFEPTNELLALGEKEVAAMDADQFRTLFRHSAIKRTKLAGLQRNLRHLRKS